MSHDALWGTKRVSLRPVAITARARVQVALGIAFAFATLTHVSAPVNAQPSVPVSGSMALRAAHDAPPVQAGDAQVPAQRILAGPSESERFWAWDFHTQEYYTVHASLRHVSPSAWIYTEDGAAVSGLAVARLAETFEDTVLPTLRARYGPEPSPGIDGQAAITLLMLDVRDGLYHDAAPHAYVSGYFDPANQQAATAGDGESDPPEGVRASNGREMVYLDVAPTDPEGPIVAQTVAHEFAHLIGWSYDPDEDAWLAEGLAQLAIHITQLGHPRAQIEAFLADPETSLVTWHGEVRDYGKTYLWLLYLYEQLDGGRSGALARWTRDPSNGMASLLAGSDAQRSESVLLRDFGMAIHVDADSHGDGRLGFRALRIDSGATPGGPAFAPPSARRHGPDDWPVQGITEELPAWTVRADAFASGVNLDIEWAPAGPACLGAAWREAAGRGEADRFEPVCMEAARPGGWLLRLDGSHTRLRTVITHVADAPLAVRLTAGPSARVQGLASRIFLPMGLRR